jgi:hypothetical protein
MFRSDITTEETTMAATTRIPQRYDVVTVHSANGPARTATVTGFNYFFERCDGVYVDYPGGAVDQLAWLHQIEQS